MIDVENKVYNELYTVINAYNSNIKMKSVPDYIPSSFPTVEFSQTDSYADVGTITNSGAKCHRVTFTLTIYTKGTQRKKDAKAILAVAVDKLALLNLTLKSNVGYAYNNDTYRIDARFEATASSNTIFRR